MGCMNFIVLISFRITIGLSLSKSWLWFPFDVNDTYLYARVLLHEFLFNGIWINRVNGSVSHHNLKTYLNMQFSDFRAWFEIYHSEVGSNSNTIPKWNRSTAVLLQNKLYSPSVELIQPNWMPNVWCQFQHTYNTFHFHREFRVCQ